MANVPIKTLFRGNTLFICFSIEVPCKVELTSNGPFKTEYAELMGVYSLVENNLCHGRPVWTKQNHFLIMDDGWLLSLIVYNLHLLILFQVVLGYCLKDTCANSRGEIPFTLDL